MRMLLTKENIERRDTHHEKLAAPINTTEPHHFFSTGKFSFHHPFYESSVAFLSVSSRPRPPDTGISCSSCIADASKTITSNTPKATTTTTKPACVPSTPIRDDRIMQLKRISSLQSTHIPRLVLTFLLFLCLAPALSLSAGLGLARQQRNPSLQPRSLDSPFIDPDRSVDVPPVDDASIKIRTREVDGRQSPLPQPPMPPQQQSGLISSPWLYNVPAVDQATQPQRPGYSPVLVPNYNYYAVYGTNWGYPETHLVGSYAPVPPVTQWVPQNYYGRPQQAQPRRRPNGKRRKDKQKCPKICETCTRSIDYSGVELEKERSVLQQRFAAHLKPSMRHKDSVESLFKYIDGNNDGSVSFTELQNYLLLHNIISPEIPDGDVG